MLLRRGVSSAGGGDQRPATPQALPSVGSCQRGRATKSPASMCPPCSSSQPATASRTSTGSSGGDLGLAGERRRREAADGVRRHGHDQRLVGVDVVARLTHQAHARLRAIAGDATRMPARPGSPRRPSIQNGSCACDHARELRARQRDARDAVVERERVVGVAESQRAARQVGAQAAAARSRSPSATSAPGTAARTCVGEQVAERATRARAARRSARRRRRRAARRAARRRASSSASIAAATSALGVTGLPSYSADDAVAGATAHSPLRGSMRVHTGCGAWMRTFVTSRARRVEREIHAAELPAEVRRRR